MRVLRLFPGGKKKKKTENKRNTFREIQSHPTYPPWHSMWKGASGPFITYKTYTFQHKSCPKWSYKRRIGVKGSVPADRLGSPLYIFTIKLNSTNSHIVLSQRDSSQLPSVCKNLYIKLLGYHLWPGGDIPPPHTHTLTHLNACQFCLSDLACVCVSDCAWVWRGGAHIKRNEKNEFKHKKRNKPEQDVYAVGVFWYIWHLCLKSDISFVLDWKRNPHVTTDKTRMLYIISVSWPKCAA